MEHLLKIDAGKLEAGLEVQLQPWQTEERIEWAKTESRADRAHLRRRVELEKIPANLPPARHYNGFPIHYNPHYEERDMLLAEIGWQQLDHFRVRYWTTNSSKTHRDSFFALTGIRLQPPGRQQPIPAAVMQLYPSLMEAPAGAAQPAVANATVEEQPVADAMEEEGAIGGEEVAVGGEEEGAVSGIKEEDEESGKEEEETGTEEEYKRRRRIGIDGIAATIGIRHCWGFTASSGVTRTSPVRASATSKKSRGCWKRTRPRLHQGSGTRTLPGTLWPQIR